MSSFQMPYSQGLVPAIQQQQLVQPTQLGAYNPPAPNMAQQAYLAALQEQIKTQQQNTAAGLKGYQDAAANKPAKKEDDGFWGFVKAAAPLALAVL